VTDPRKLAEAVARIPRRFRQQRLAGLMQMFQAPVDGVRRRYIEQPFKAA